MDPTTEAASTHKPIQNQLRTSRRESNADAVCQSETKFTTPNQFGMDPTAGKMKTGRSILHPRQANSSQVAVDDSEHGEMERRVLFES